MLPQHEHGFPALLVQLLEQNQRPLVEPQAALLVSVHDVQGVLSPVSRDVVFLERDRKNLVARVVDRYAEGLEDFDLGVARG